MQKMIFSNSNYYNSIQEAVVGFSGGADSVALLHYLKYRTNINLVAVHINHQLQPNSIEWELFCKDFCKTHDISFFSIKVNISEGNIEAKAREARLNVFNQFNLEHIFLAHHLNDQTETLMLKLLRGSGVRGLKCMTEFSKQGGKTICRPLLLSDKQSILNYCAEHNLKYVHDGSNDEVDFDRNAIRNDVFCSVKKYFPSFIKSWAKSISALQDAEECLNDLAEMDLQAVLQEGKISIKKVRERKLSSTRIRNMLQYKLNSLNFSTSFQELKTFSEALLTVGYDRNLELSLKGATKGKLKQKGKFLEIKVETQT